MDRINYKRCIQACFACASACLNCATEALKQPNFRTFALCVSLNRECALLCTATAQLLAMGGKNALLLCNICANICETCATECERYLELKHCRHCAEECHRCAEECHHMIFEEIG